MKYREIQAAFPICSVYITKMGITLFFHSSEEARATVTVNNDEFHNKGIFMSLLNRAASIKISIKPGSATGFRFGFPTPVDMDIILNPIEETKTSEEIQEELYSLISGREPTGEWTRAFANVDLSDDEEVLSGISDFLGSVNKDKVFQFSSIARWRDLEREVKQLHKSWSRCEVVFEPPDKYVDFGVADFILESGTEESVELKRSTVRQLLRAAEVSSSIVLDSYQRDGNSVFILSFYS